VSYRAPVILLLLIAVVLGGFLTVGWVMFAGETSVRAANALLLMFAGVGLAIWMLSEVTFDAGF
jgi:hypothetical protein